MRVVKVTYSEELSSESSDVLFEFIKKALMNRIAQSDLKLKALLLSDAKEGNKN